MSVANYPFDFYSAQSEQQPAPTTLASAATITPTQKFTRVTGTTSITKVVPPVDAYHELTFIFSSAYANAFNTGGSGDGAIHAAYTSVADRPVTLYYDPRTGLYYVQTVA
jgi:hypothetical protein